MKKILLLTLIPLVCSCVSNVDANEKNINPRFINIEDTNYSGHRIVVDTKTRVEYVVSNCGCSEGVFTLLVNADGSPCVYKGPL